METKIVYKHFRILNWWTDDVWYIGCRMSPQSMIGGQDNANFYKLLRPTYKYWFADPIPFVLDGKHYIFMEVYDRFRKKGYIGVSDIDTKKMTVHMPVKIIEEPFHMSFPYIFRYHGKAYMIPETHEAKQIRIYKMGESIYEWNLYHAYDTQNELSDTIVLLQDDVLYLLNTEKNSKNPYQTKMHLLKIENLEAKSALIEIPLNMPASNSQVYSYSNRNGGHIIEDKDKLYRVIQEAEDMWYGKDIVIREILKYGDNGYSESANITKLEADKLPIRIRRRHAILGMHTYGYSNGFEVIDISARQLSYIMFRGFVQRNMKKLKKKMG